MPDLPRFSSSMLMEKPLDLFIALHESLRPVYRQVSNPLHTSPDARDRFDSLTGEILFRLEHIHGSPSVKKDRIAFESFIGEYSSGSPQDYGIFCLATLKALGHYLGRYFKGPLKRLGCLEKSGIIVSARPANPTHENTSHPVRRAADIGKDAMKDVLSHVYSLISIIRPSNPRIGLLRPEGIDQTNSYFERRLREGFRMAVSPLPRTLEPEVDSLLGSWPSHETTPYWFKRIADRDAARVHLIRTLEKCVEERIALLVLPELMIDEELLEAARHWLRENNRERVAKGDGGLLMLVAGSFHKGENEESLYNVSTVLNHRGDILWAHKKLRRFAFHACDIQAAPGLKTLCKTSDSGGHERILTGDTLGCVDTPAGRIAVCICLDFLQDGNDDLMEIFKNSEANVFLVPAMTPGVTGFQDTARMLGRANQACALIANSRMAVAPGKRRLTPDEASFIYVPDTRSPFFPAVDVCEELLCYEIIVNG